MTTKHWVYIRSEPGLWTVGFYTPATAAWHTDSDHDTKEAAANRVAFLNGANAHAALVAALREAKHSFSRIGKREYRTERDAHDIAREADKRIDAALAGVQS